MQLSWRNAIGSMHDLAKDERSRCKIWKICLTEDYCISWRNFKVSSVKPVGGGLARITVEGKPKAIRSLLYDFDKTMVVVLDGFRTTVGKALSGLQNGAFSGRPLVRAVKRNDVRMLEV